MQINNLYHESLLVVVGSKYFARNGELLTITDIDHAGRVTAETKDGAKYFYHNNMNSMISKAWDLVEREKPQDC